MEAFILLIACTYFLPTIIAIMRTVPNTGSVAVINLFLGWTLVGWVASLALASRSMPPESPARAAEAQALTWKD